LSEGAVGVVSRPESLKRHAPERTAGNTTLAFFSSTDPETSP
jgi:hypothetical protein